MKINSAYKTKDDINFFLEASNLTIDELSKKTKISKETIYQIIKGKEVKKEVLEKLYDFIYSSRYSLNRVKEELLKEEDKDIILFHGSKNGISEIKHNGSRENCDFGNGFYMGENYDQAMLFVCENYDSSIYSFKWNSKNLKIKKFKVELDWMLAICFYRGYLTKYASSKKIKKIISEINDVDVVVAPIADNRMFYIMSSFANGDINEDVALHSLSASDLGKQYVFKTKKSIDSLKLIEKYYICEKEKEYYKKILRMRADEIETKLKLVKREYRNGLFIEEILK